MADSSGPETISKAAAARKIVATAAGIHADIVKKHKKPSMRFPIRSLQNVKYDVKRGHFEILNKTAERTLSYNTVKTFAQSMRLLATTKNDLLDKDDIAGKREVYYNAKSWGECRFDEQPESDALLDDMEAMLAINREQLGYIPEERGGDVCGCDRPRADSRLEYVYGQPRQYARGGEVGGSVRAVGCVVCDKPTDSRTVLVISPLRLRFSGHEQETNGSGWFVGLFCHSRRA